MWALTCYSPNKNYIIIPVSLYDTTQKSNIQQCTNYHTKQHNHMREQSSSPGHTVWAASHNPCQRMLTHSARSLTKSLSSEFQIHISYPVVFKFGPKHFLLLIRNTFFLPPQFSPQQLERFKWPSENYVATEQRQFCILFSIFISFFSLPALLLCLSLLSWCWMTVADSSQ